jgi:hypothetical protein
MLIREVYRIAQTPVEHAMTEMGKKKATQRVAFPNNRG